MPASASLRHPLVNPRNQGSTSSCVGFACAQAVRLAYLRQSVDCPDLSPLFAYFLSRATHQDQARNEGTYIRACIHAIKKLGIAAESSWAFSRLRVNKAPSFRAHHDAHDRRGIRGYFRIASGDLEGIRRAIAAGYPVVAGWDIDDSFFDVRGGMLISAQREPFVAGHSAVIESYESDGSFGLLNSWGTGWADFGRGHASEAFVSQARDIWAMDVGAA